MAVVRKIKRYGWIPDLPDHRDHPFIPQVGAPTRLPDHVDLSAKGPPIWDQGEIGSCSAHGGSRVWLYEAMAQPGTHAIMPSRLYLYYNTRAIEGSTREDSGARIRDVIKALVMHGVCQEDHWPYDIAKFADRPPQACYDQGTRHQALSYRRISANITDMMDCLAHGHPFVFGFSVYEGFEAEAVANTGVLHLPEPSEALIGGHCVCLHEDTMVPLLDGTEHPIKELAARDHFWVYSCDKAGRVVPGKASLVRQTGSNREMVAVTLDSGTVLRCTPDHLIMLRDGSYRKAGELRPCDSLMPLYRRISDENDRQPGYEMVWQPNDGRWQFTHRAMIQAQDLHGKIVHHDDFNKRNNIPTNLVPKTWLEHNKLHAEHVAALNRSPEFRARSSMLMKKLWANPEWAEKTRRKNGLNGSKTCKKLTQEGKCGWQLQTPVMKAANRQNGLRAMRLMHQPEKQAKARETWHRNWETDQEFREKIQARGRNNWKRYGEMVKSGERPTTEKQREARRKNAAIALQARKERLAANNHMVVDVRPCSPGAVYDLTVEEHHNFAISAGIFVHNCAVGYNKGERTFLCANSWGTGWGLPSKRGYFTMPFDYISNPHLADDRWTLTRVEEGTTFTKK